LILQPVTLRGASVRLEPLTIGHVPALTRVGLDPELWRWQPKVIATADDMREYVQAALDQQTQGEGLPFVIVDPISEQVVGSTRYFDVALRHRRLEIGATWIARSHQRTALNTEAKLLLLTHAFETLGAGKVVLKTEMLNEQSRRAILRLGAIEEGRFRRHLLADSGRPRDMVYFSILEAEWPTVKARLREKLEAYR
jgi:RimJ/RimL family protein N-acetyltransferase